MNDCADFANQECNRSESIACVALLIHKDDKNDKCASPAPCVLTWDDKDVLPVVYEPPATSDLTSKQQFVSEIETPVMS